MLGFSDPWIAAGYLLCLLATALCVVYGAINWNNGDEPPPTDEDAKWAEEKERIDDSL